MGVNHLSRGMAAAALTVPLLTAAAPAAAPAVAMPAGIDCPGGYVCTRDQLRRAVDGSVKDLPSAIRDHGSPVGKNSDRTARVYEKRNFSGRWVCVTMSGGSIHDLRGYNLNDQTRSPGINRNDCGWQVLRSAWCLPRGKRGSPRTNYVPYPERRMDRWSPGAAHPLWGDSHRKLSVRPGGARHGDGHDDVDQDSVEDFAA
ncbi:hypothetical protein GCM10017744_078940 [Streptomyces antimycoticus]